MGNSLNKRKIINDPVYGFISIRDEIIFDLIEHPWFQRLRRIKQLGLTNLVYPGALHTRFHHAIGAMHLMSEAIEVLKYKGVKLTKQEEIGVIIAILLHDIGHGPFSHALEHSIVHKVTHEDISELFLDQLNIQFKGKLSTAIAIFRNTYEKPFLHQLVSSQLDVDRLDYLKRDSFYTGVSEGVVGSDRIIKMINVNNGQLVVDAKGIYSIEKFIVARRLMYWQVYLHKTVIGAESLLVNILKRAKFLALKNEFLFCTPAFSLFLYKKYSKLDFINNNDLLAHFAELDDNDVMTSIKVWVNHSDRILSQLCKKLINRDLFHVELQNEPFKEIEVKQVRERTAKVLRLRPNEIDYFVYGGIVENDAYRSDKIKISILFRDGCVKDIAKASDQIATYELLKTVRKYYLCYPKSIV